MSEYSGSHEHRTVKRILGCAVALGLGATTLAACGNVDSAYKEEKYMKRAEDYPTKLDGTVYLYPDTREEYTIRTRKSAAFPRSEDNTAFEINDNKYVLKIKQPVVVADNQGQNWIGCKITEGFDGPYEAEDKDGYVWVALSYLERNNNPNIVTKPEQLSEVPAYYKDGTFYDNRRDKHPIGICEAITSQSMSEELSGQ